MKMENVTGDILEFSTRTSGFSWGEIVTIIRVENKLLINTQPKGKSAFTFFKEKENYKKIQNLMQKYYR